MKTHTNHPRPRTGRGFSTIASLAVALLVASPAMARDDGPLVKLLKSGRVPEARLQSIVGMVGERGSADDLAYLYGRVLEPDGFPAPARVAALDALADAARTRKTKPTGDLAGLGDLLKGGDPDPAVRLAAIRLAGAWGVESLLDPLRAIATAPKAPESQRAAATAALAQVGEAGRAVLESIDAEGQPPADRARAVAALAGLDTKEAAGRAVALLDAWKGPQEALVPMFGAILDHQDGADALAAAVDAAMPTADAAKRALRAVYALGRADAPLVASLSKVAGLDAEVRAPTPEEMAALVAEVASHGDPGRGESIFRRADLNCMQCHAVARAGGAVGPDLSALGSSSPVDYIINSVMLPDQAIKEQYQTLVVLTADGRVLHGIVADRNDQRIVLKEATGQLREIPADEVEDQKEGGSLMPKGLVNLMTRDEFVDLVRFLSELGKPGPYEISATPTVQRWRVLAGTPDDPETPPPADDDRWSPAYARVSGALPLKPLESISGAPILYLKAEVDLAVAGPIEFRLGDAKGIRAWVDGKPAVAGATIPADLDRGRHSLILRVDTAAYPGDTLRVEVARPAASPAEFTVVGGP